MSWADIDAEFQSIQAATERAFYAAANEPKILERQPLLDSVSAPEMRGARGDGTAGATTTTHTGTGSTTADGGAVDCLADWSYSNRRERKAGKGSGPTATTAKSAPAEVMRKLMTAVFDEALGGHSPAGAHAIYLGEDVRHGG